MGGGITRSFGLLFALLALRSLGYPLHGTCASTHLDHLPSGVRLIVLSHPGGRRTVCSRCTDFFLVLDRSYKGAIYAFATAGLILILSAPWWATMLARDGVGAIFGCLQPPPVMAPSLTFQPVSLLTFQFNFTEEFYLPLIAFLGLIGLFASLARREFLLPLWVTITPLL